MKILLVSDYATPTGGAELMVLSLRAALRGRGHDARLLASSAKPLGMESEADYKCFGITSQLRGLIQIANPSAYLTLKRVLREFDPDVVHVRLFMGQLSPAILTLLADVPSIFHVAWYRSICPIGTKTLPDFKPCREHAGLPCLKHGCVAPFTWPFLMLQNRLCRHWMPAFQRVVANSHATKSQLEAEGVPVSEVVWNGVPLRAARLPLTGPPTVAFAGRLVPEKGVDVLIDAFARVVSRIPDAKLLLAGDGPERRRLESRIQQLNIAANVIMLGHISRTDMEEHFASAWAQVVPSRWEEPFGIAAAEAMMRGTAVVVSNIGGLAEFVRHDDTGVLVPPSDVDALTDALLDLLRDPAQADRLGKNARAFALRSLTEDVFVERFIALYQSISRRQALAATN